MLLCCNMELSLRCLGVVDPESQEPQLFASGEPKPEPVQEPDFDPDPKWNGMQSSKNHKWDVNFLGNNAAFNTANARFCRTNFVLDIVWVRIRILIRIRNRNFSEVGTRNRNKSLRFHNTDCVTKDFLKTDLLFRANCILKRNAC